MRSMKKWGPIAAAVFLLMSGFQNCSPVEFKEADTELASLKGANDDDTTATSSDRETPQIPKSISVPLTKICELEKKKEGQLWMSPAGQVRDTVQCEVGIGNRFNISNISKEYRCTDGSAVLTGRVEKTFVGVEGMCNLDCGTHKNGESWWLDLANSSETLQCATSLNATSTVKYQNQAEYACKDAVASATGKIAKNRLEETACPPLTFNDQDNQATLAFEDIYPTPLDSDYNDFVSNIKVIETYNSLGELNRIILEYAAKSIGGGLPHKLVSVFDGTVRGRDGWVSNQNIFKTEEMFKGNASIKYELFTAGKLTRSNAVAKNEDLVVFESTRQAAEQKMVARITVSDIDGKQNLLSVRKGVSIKRYRTLLYVPNSTITANGETYTFSKVPRYDIDISDINPAAYDETGRPLAFFVPVNWRAPKSGVHILKAYPDFQMHADYMKNSIANPKLVESDKAKNWFNNVILNFVD